MILKVLREEYQRRKGQNRKYSLRAYARSLKLHSSTLCAIMKEKRKITPRQAQKILLELKLSPKDRQLILINSIDKAISPSKVYDELSDEVFTVIKGWEHFALLSCLDLDLDSKSSRHLASLLNLSEPYVSDALERLERFGLVKRKRNQWSATGKCFTTTHEIPSEAVRYTHREYMQKAISSLDNHSVQERDITGMTMAISTKKLATAKEMISKFRREMAEYLECDSRDQVYRLNIQLFPLTKKEGL